MIHKQKQTKNQKDMVPATIINNKQDSAIFTHVYTNTGREFVKPIATGERISINYKRCEIDTLKASIYDSRIMMQNPTKVRSKLLKKQLILQNIYMN